MSNLQANELITGECRLSYANLLKPVAITPGNPAKFSVKLLIPKTDQETINKLKSAIAAAVATGVEKNTFQGFNTQRLAALRVNLEDGDVKFADNPECAGMWCLNASSPADKPPGVLIKVDDKTNKRVDNETDIYSGMYGRVHIQLYGYNKAGNSGIGVGLVNVLKTRDGDPLGGAGRKSAEDVFGGVAEDVFGTAPASGSPI